MILQDISLFSLPVLLLLQAVWVKSQLCLEHNRYIRANKINEFLRSVISGCSQTHIIAAVLIGAYGWQVSRESAELNSLSESCCISEGKFVLVVLFQVFSCVQRLYRSLCWSVHRNSPLSHGHSFHDRRLKFVIKVKCVCVCVSLVYANRLKGGVAMWVAYCKKTHNFQMDSQTFTRFSRKVGHEPEDSWLTVCANWQKGAWQWEWPVMTKCKTSKRIHVTWPNFVKAHVCTHTQTFIVHCLSHPSPTL